MCMNQKQFNNDGTVVIFFDNVIIPGIKSYANVSTYLHHASDYCIVLNLNIVIDFFNICASLLKFM